VQLQQLLLNLMVNALEALEPVSGRVKQLSVRTTRTGADHAMIQICDNGVGLDDPVAAFECTRPESRPMVPTSRQQQHTADDRSTTPARAALRSILPAFRNAQLAPAEHSAIDRVSTRTNQDQRRGNDRRERVRKQ
jgi:hypothetical protein